MNDEQLSPGRRRARVFVWITFGLVLFVRFAFFREERPPQNPPELAWQRERPRFRRPATRVQAPVAEIPKDLFRLKIDVAPQDVAVLRGYFWNGWRGQRGEERPEVTVTVEEGGTVYRNVSLHLKGAAGSFRDFDDKPALTLNFSKHDPKQQFRGYTKISLNNSVQDPSYLCEAISRELFDAAGVPVPKADFATVVLNGRDLGLYVLLEGYNKRFLHRYFKNVKGNLYDGGFCQDINGHLGVNSGDHPEDHSDLSRLASAAYEPVPTNRWAKLTQVLDVDRFINMLVMETLLCHWDGYGMNRNNYRVFHDLESDRMVFMPHGLDQMFGFPPHRFDPESSIQPNMSGLVARAVLGTPEGGRLFSERLGILFTNLCREQVILDRVRQLAGRIRPTLAAYDPGMAQWHDSAVSSLCERISRRLESVRKQLETPSEALSFDSNGSAPLIDWPQRFTTQGSVVQMNRVEGDGARLLHIAAAGNGGTGSWRTRVVLTNGQYRFEGRARASTDAVGGRVALRLSGSARNGGIQLTGTEWVPLSFPFTVEGFRSEVTLVCEFSGRRGEAWFDLDSLRLVKQ